MKEADVKVTKLTEEDDIQAYLTMFEHLMQAYDVQEEQWAFKLVLQLVGKAQHAYVAMKANDTKD